MKATSAIADSVQSKPAMATFVTTLFHARTQVHQLHLGTKSYAAHKALDEFYNNIVPLVDELAEAYQGKYDLIVFKDIPCKTVQRNNELNYMQGLKEFVCDNREDLPQDSELQNIVDEIANLINSTLYKLRFLS